MLKHLQIANLAIVDRLELEFDRGMTVLTGETGAGKSILLDALGLALGERADSTLVRHGAERAEVTAEFATDGLKAVTRWLHEQELDADGECIIRRTLGSDGRSRAFINGQQAPVQTLKSLGDLLVDIHGQHAHQSLLHRDAQRDLLDHFGGHEALVEATAAAYRSWRTLADEFEELSREATEREQRRELLTFQVQELDALALGEGELPELEAEHHRLANGARLLAGGERAVQTLYEGDEGSVSAMISEVLGELRSLAEVDNELNEPTGILESALIQVQEAASGLRHYVSGLDMEPERLAEVEQRLADVHDLARKHRVEGGELPQLLEKLQIELATLEQAGARLDGMETEIEQARQQFLKAAGQLSEARREAAERLGNQVSEDIRRLGMGEGRFEIELEPLEEQAGAQGLERIEFRVSANPGQPLRPLSKVASGGELSRISLAIQVATAGRGGVPTLIYDEVDVGIGGGVAEMVGRRLRELGQTRQVLCVTHQPQVAALGNQHFRVNKETDGQSTTTRIEVLDAEGRVAEVARMLGGLEVTAQTESHAWELLARGRD